MQPAGFRPMPTLFSRLPFSVQFSRSANSPTEPSLAARHQPAKLKGWQPPDRAETATIRHGVADQATMTAGELGGPPPALALWGLPPCARGVCPRPKQLSLIFMTVTALMKPLLCHSVGDNYMSKIVRDDFPDRPWTDPKRTHLSDQLVAGSAFGYELHRLESLKFWQSAGPGSWSADEHNTTGNADRHRNLTSNNTSREQPYSSTSCRSASRRTPRNSSYVLPELGFPNRYFSM